MNIQNKTALVTGANRGLGAEITKALLKAGVRKVYAGVRDPQAAKFNDQRIIAVKLDVTDPEQVKAISKELQDVDIVINNAGIAKFGGFLAADSESIAKELFDVNVYGVLRVSQAFAPQLKKAGGGALVNILSLASFINSGDLAPYAMSKAAAWSLTNALRNELRAQNTLVTGVHVGFMDTQMAEAVTLEKVHPEDVARQIVQAITEGQTEVLADQITQTVKEHLSDGIYLTAIERE